jgi:VWFA-related protein
VKPGRIVAIALLVAIPLLVQAQQQPTFRARVDLIQVNVVAVDASGKHVYGLTAPDFTVLDRGRPQAIATFQEIDARTPPADQGHVRLPAQVRRDVASNQLTDLDRLVILVIDDLHIYKGRTDRAKEVARDAVAKLAPGAFMAVLFTTGDNSTEVTDDSSRLVRAVDTLAGRQPWRRPNQAVDAQTPAPLNPEGGIENLDIVNRNQQTKLQQFFDNMSQFKALEDAARLLRLSTARRKAFVLVTEGVWLNPTGAYDEPAADCPQASPCYHWRAVQDMMRSLRRSNVATYALDPRGHVTSQQLALESHPSPAGLLGTAGGSASDEDQVFRWFNPVRAAQDGLKLMAEASGGFAVTDDDDLTGGLSRIIEDLDHYYLLGFYPADPEGPQYRPLEVKTDREGLTLRFRRAYAEVGPPDPPKKGTDPLAQLVTGALPSSDVPMRLQAIQLPALTKDTRVAFALELSLPPDRVPARDDRRLDDIRYGLFVADLKNGKVVQQFTNTAQVLGTAEGPAKQPSDTIRYQILTALTLPPGNYQVRASVMSDTLAAGGSVFLPLTVADSSRATLGLSDLVLGYASGPRAAIARDKTVTTEDSVRLPLEPELDRVFSPGESVRLFASVTRRLPLDVTATVSARTPDGTTVFSEKLTIPVGDDAIDMILPLSSLAPGPHVLKVHVSDSSRGAERELGFAIR